MDRNLVEGDKLLSGLYLQLMAVNILIALVQPCNLFMDSMITGKGLGVAAMNAYALFLPVGCRIKRSKKQRNIERIKVFI